MFSEKDIKRFWSKVKIGTPDECWEWQAYKRQGYGRFSINGHSDTSNRVAYRLVHGDIPYGRIICHRCNNRACCNPAHIYAGTRLDNVHDAISANTFRLPARMYGADHPNTKLSDDDVRLIRTLYVPGVVTLKQLAARFGVCEAEISVIARHRARRHVT